MDDGAHDLRGTLNLPSNFALHEGWVEVDHSPAARPGTYGCAVVNFPGIYADYVAAGSLYSPYAAPGPMSSEVHDPEAQLIMGVPRKILIGDEGHGLDPQKGCFMLLDLMDARTHIERPKRLLVNAVTNGPSGWLVRILGLRGGLGGSPR